MTSARPLPRFPRWFWPAILICGSLLAALLLIDPLDAMLARPGVCYNDGWNAYHQQEAAQGVPLYGKPPTFTNTNYPSLSFHLIAVLAGKGGDLNRTGRAVALLSFGLVAGLCGLIVRRLSGSGVLGMYTALNVVIWISVYKPDRVGANEPQMLATAVSLAALYLYIQSNGRLAWLVSSAAVFAVSVFIKHNLLAFPAAVALHLASERRWKPLAVWGGAAVAVSSILFALTLRIDGPYFLASLLLPRSSNGQLTVQLGKYGTLFQFPIALAAVWGLRNRRGSPCFVIVLALAVAHLLAAPVMGYEGSDINIFFDAIFCLIMAGSLSFVEFAPAIEGAFTGGATRFAALAALLLAPATGILIQVPPRLFTEWFDVTYHHPRAVIAFDAQVERIKRAPGPVICDDLLICFDAGKPFDYEPFVANSRMRAEPQLHRQAVQWIEEGRFGAVQLNNPELLVAAQPRASAPLLQALAKHYHPDPEFPNIFLPNR